MKTAIYTADGGITITTLDAETGAVTGGESYAGSHPQLTEIVAALEAEGVTIAPYVAPAEPTTAELRKQALSTLDPLVAQITRYKLLGEDSTIAEAKLVAAMDKIDAEFPNA